MRLEKVEPWLTLTANLGVIVGLVFLIVEVNQNTAAIRNEADIAIASIGSAQAALIIQHPELADLLLQSETEDWDSFSSSERLQLGVFWALLVDRLELQHQLSQRAGEPLRRDDMIFPEQYLEMRSFRQWWGSSRRMYSEEFVPFFEELMK